MKFMINIITYNHPDNAGRLSCTTLSISIKPIISKGGIPCKNQYSIRERKFRGMQD